MTRSQTKEAAARNKENQQPQQSVHRLGDGVFSKSKAVYSKSTATDIPSTIRVVSFDEDEKISDEIPKEFHGSWETKFGDVITIGSNGCKWYQYEYNSDIGCEYYIEHHGFLQLDVDEEDGDDQSSNKRKTSCTRSISFKGEILWMSEDVGSGRFSELKLHLEYDPEEDELEGRVCAVQVHTDRILSKFTFTGIRMDETETHFAENCLRDIFESHELEAAEDFPDSFGVTLHTYALL